MLKLILQLFLFVLTLTLKEEKFPQREQMSALVLHFCKKNKYYCDECPIIYYNTKFSCLFDTNKLVSVIKPTIHHNKN